MAKQSAEVVVEGLKKILIEEEGMDEEVQEKDKKLIAELQGRPLSPDQDAQRLEDGFQFFKNNLFDKYPEIFHELAKGQHPKFLVFACSDSRVSPSIILNFKLGEAFVSRNIANMVPPFDQLRHTETGAVIEYAVTALQFCSSFYMVEKITCNKGRKRRLQVENILIIGHSLCGGIQRLMDLPDEHCSHNHTYDFIDDWVKIGLPAKRKVLEEAYDLPLEEQIKLCEKESVKNSMANLLTYPYVRNAVENGIMTLRGGYYDFVEGTFEQWKLGPKPCHQQ
ncbi:carbonic anhydrase 2-like isoform X1 [Durio zibethinus]|uniref:Carbonic anhydrase n=1 Tax=Durio zibethinus TaxID=66656 RepID=A0A6P5Y9H7_DURZI|nr:carbonic anhydrase 2-like isoform X1 [Durio zibethinus]